MSIDVFVHQTSLCESSEVGEGTKIWHFCHVMSGARIGPQCVLGQNCFVATGTMLGARVRLQNNVSVVSGVVLEDDVFCGPGVVFTNVKRPRAFIDQKAQFCTTRVDRGATLGANATILPGVQIGAYALIGAGAVVVADVPPYAEAVGNPATVRGWVSRAGAPLRFGQRDRAHCPESGELYRLIAEGEHARCELVDS